MPRRSYNAELADLAAEHAIDLVRFDAGARREILGFLRRLETKLLERVRVAQIGVGDGPRLAREMNLLSLLSQVQATIRAEYAAMEGAQRSVSASLARWESAEAIRPLRGVAIAAQIELNVLTPEKLRALAADTLIQGAPSSAWWARQSEGLVNLFAEEMREGIARDETIDELVRRVRGRATGRRHVYELNGRKRMFVEFQGGLMDTATRNAEALVRTSVATVSAQARRDTYEANQDVVKGVVQVSTLDTRTTVICIARAGKAWAYPDMAPIDHDISYGEGVPLHYNCRSTEAPLLRSWQELGIDLEDRAAGKRWSRLDGKVPGDFTFDDFFKRRSPEQIAAQLGSRAAELYREGKLDLDDLISHATSRPLRVADVERLAEAA